MFPNPPGLLRLEPYSDGLRDRIWWGAGSNATAIWAAKLGMNLQSSTLKNDETGEAFHVQQAAQIRAYRAAWKEAGHAREPRVSVSRSIFALVDNRDRAYFGRGREDDDQIGFIDDRTRAIFGRSYAAEPDVLIDQLRKDEAIAEADTLLLTVPNQLGVAYNAHVIEAILTHVAPAMGGANEAAWHISLKRESDLSVAFTKEDSAETASETLLPDHPVSPHPNLVTEARLKALKFQLHQAREAYETAQKIEDVNERRRQAAIPLRDLRYFAARVRTAQVIINPTSTDTVAFGSTVTFRRDDGRVQKYRIVGEDEADPKAGSISFVSPVARVLMGKAVGDVVGASGQNLEIISIS